MKGIIIMNKVLLIGCLVCVIVAGWVPLSYGAKVGNEPLDAQGKPQYIKELNDTLHQMDSDHPSFCFPVVIIRTERYGETEWRTIHSFRKSCPYNVFAIGVVGATGLLCFSPQK